MARSGATEEDDGWLLTVINHSGEGSWHPFLLGGGTALRQAGAARIARAPMPFCLCRRPTCRRGAQLPGRAGRAATGRRPCGAPAPPQRGAQRPARLLEPRLLWAAGGGAAARRAVTGRAQGGALERGWDPSFHVTLVLYIIALGNTVALPLLASWSWPAYHCCWSCMPVMLPQPARPPAMQTSARPPFMQPCPPGGIEMPGCLQSLYRRLAPRHPASRTAADMVMGTPIFGRLVVFVQPLSCRSAFLLSRTCR